MYTSQSTGQKRATPGRMRSVPSPGLSIISFSSPSSSFATWKYLPSPSLFTPGCLHHFVFSFLTEGPPSCPPLQVIGGLEPEFFYGHRGHDRYGNLHYASTGELVFSISIFVVVFNIETRTQRIFRVISIPFSFPSSLLPLLPPPSFSREKFDLIS